MSGALPVVRVSVDGATCDALLDTGCSLCVAHVSVCRNWNRDAVSVMTVSGDRYWCEGTGVVEVRSQSGESVSVRVLVVSRKPLGFEFILGMNGVSALGGVTVSAENHVRFGAETTGVAAVAERRVPETAPAAAGAAAVAERRAPETAPAAAGSAAVAERRAPETAPAAAGTAAVAERRAPEIRRRRQLGRRRWLRDGCLRRRPWQLRRRHWPSRLHPPRRRNLGQRQLGP